VEAQLFSKLPARLNRSFLSYTKVYSIKILVENVPLPPCNIKTLEDLGLTFNFTLQCI